MRGNNNLESAFGIQKRHAFFRDNKASIWKKTLYITLHFTAFRIIIV